MHKAFTKLESLSQNSVSTYVLCVIRNLYTHLSFTCTTLYCSTLSKHLDTQMSSARYSTEA